MKNLIIACLFMVLLAASCSLFLSYSKGTVEGFSTAINETIIPAAQSADWETATEAMNSLSDKWDSYKQISLFFLSNRDMDEAEAVLHKASEYITNHDASSACGELAYLDKTLLSLHNSQCLSWENLF